MGVRTPLLEFNPLSTSCVSGLPSVTRVLRCFSGAFFWGLCWFWKIDGVDIDTSGPAPGLAAWKASHGRLEVFEMLARALPCCVAVFG
jgi:hypothetical protein